MAKSPAFNGILGVSQQILRRNDRLDSNPWLARTQIRQPECVSEPSSLTFVAESCGQLSRVTANPRFCRSSRSASCNSSSSGMAKWRPGRTSATLSGQTNEPSISTTLLMLQSQRFDGYLGDQATEAKYIETVARRGYRLIPSPVWLSAVSDPAVKENGSGLDQAARFLQQMPGGGGDSAGHGR